MKLLKASSSSDIYLLWENRSLRKRDRKRRDRERERERENKWGGRKNEMGRVEE